MLRPEGERVLPPVRLCSAGSIKLAAVWVGYEISVFYHVTVRIGVSARIGGLARVGVLAQGCEKRVIGVTQFEYGTEIVCLIEGRQDRDTRGGVGPFL